MKRFLLVFSLLFMLLGIGNAQIMQTSCADAANDVTSFDPTAAAFAVTSSGSNTGAYMPSTVSSIAEVTYFRVDLPADGTYNIVMTGSTFTGALSIGWISNCATSDPDVDEIEFFGDASIDPISSCNQFTAGQYVFAIASESAGTFNVEFQSTTPPGNDDCANADALSSGAPTTGSNLCATPDATDICGISTTKGHVVYYTYAVTSTTTTEVTINVSGTGTPATDVSLGVWTDCTGTDYTGTNAPTSGDVCGTLGNDVVFSCILPGTTLTIAVASPNGSEGDFNITVTEDNSSYPLDDVCANADAITINADCTWQPEINNNTGACSEVFATGSCATNTDRVVWQSVTLPANAIGLEFRNISGGYLVLLTDCTDTPSYAGDASDCISSDQQVLNLTGGDTYYIATGIAGGGEGDIMYEIKSITPPNNEDCVDAVALPTDGSSTPGTNACASPDATDICGISTTTGHVVYYTYAVTSATSTQVTINVSGTGTAATDVSLGVWTDCSGTDYTATNAPTSGDVCGTLGNDVVFECVQPGTNLTIAVASPNGSEGDFDITVTEDNSGVPSDDVCANAEVITIAADCTWQPEMNNNTGACSEAFMLGSCATNTDRIVWQSITLPSNAVGLEFRNVSGGYLELLTDCTDTPSYAGDATDCISGDQQVLGLTGGNTYYLATGMAGGGEGDIMYEIKTITPPNNDLCADADVLASGSPTTGSNVCATPDATDICGISTMTGHVVYYTYAVTSATSTQVTINVSGTGTAATDVSLGVWTDCAGTDYTATNSPTSGDVCGALGNDVVFECVQPGTNLTIAVASPNGSEGDFDITVTEDNSGVPSDDVCTNATPITIANDCAWQPEMNNNTGACPEFFPLTSCMTDMDRVVWQEITLSADAEGLEFRNIANGYVAVFSDCGDIASGTAPTLAGEDAGGNPITDCFTADTKILGLTPGATYYIATGIAGGGEGDITYEIKTITPPNNDDCTDAEVLTLATATSGTTVCATGPVTTGTCDSDKTNTVWYSYTVLSTDKDLKIDVTNFTPADVGGSDMISVMVLDDCASTTVMNQADGSPADYCGASGTELLRFTCLEENTVLYIMVSSSDANAGTFDITINSEPVDPTCVDNDLCANVDNSSFSTPIVTNDPEVCATDCNTSACPDDEINTLCGGTVYNTVFYEITTDGNLDPSTTEAFISANVSGLTDPVIMILEGSCGSYSLLPGTACYAGTTGSQNAGWDGSGAGLQPNTTYTIVVGTVDNMGGQFDLCVKVFTGCANDEPCTASQVDGLTGDGSTVTITDPATTENCNNDLSNCGSAGQSTAWYSVEIPAGVNTLLVDVTNVDVTGAISLLYTSATDCNAVLGATFEEDCDIKDQKVINCVQEGEVYYFQVGSQEDADEGDFTITFTTEQRGPANDRCETPEVLAVAADCNYQSTPGTLVDACPFGVTSGGCMYDQNGTVFYEITIPSSPIITSMDVRVTGLGQPMFAILSSLDCADPPSSVVVSGGTEPNNGCVTNPNGTELVPVEAGNTYYIMVSSQNNEQSTFNLEIALNVPPINDNACNTGDNPSALFSGTYSGTTCCARGTDEMNPDGSAADFDPQDCAGAALNENVVWHHFMPNPSDEGYDLMFTGSNMSVEVYWGAIDMGCTGGSVTKIATDCTNGMLEKKIPNCPPSDTDVIHVRVSSSEDDCGTYSLTINPAMCSDPTADDCPDAMDIGQLDSPDCEEISDGKFVNGCLYYACPENPSPGGCPEFGNTPTVWFTATVDDEAAKIVANVSPGSTWDPRITIFQGDDCSNLTLLTDSGGCSSSEGSATNIQGIYAQGDPPMGGKVWIAVSYDPNSVSNNSDLNFQLEVRAEKDCLDCAGTEGGCDAIIQATIVSRSSDRTDTKFCPGEEVNVCLEFSYDASQSTTDWLQGLMPRFGNGWDNVYFDPNAAVVTPGGAQWLEWDDTNCGPTASVNFPLVRTYYDANGDLQYCHTGCENCPSGASPVTAGEPMPSGWFYISDGGSTCDNSSCRPGDRYGLFGSSGVTTVQICMDLKVKEEFETTCEDERKLDISILPTSDALTGCWPVGDACIRDDLLLGPQDWEIDCVELPEVIASGTTEICSPDEAMINFSTEAGFGIRIYAVDNPNITRTANGTDVGTDPNSPFESGSNSLDITDLLENTSGSSQIQLYVFSSYDLSGTIICPSPLDTFEVIVHSEITVDFTDVQICEGACTDLTPTVTGGSGTYTYQWNTGGTADTENVCPTGSPTTYTVVVSDDFGCMDDGEVVVTLRPKPTLDIVDEYTVCKDPNHDPTDPQYTIEVTATSEGFVNNVLWDSNPPTGLDWSIVSAPGLEIAINEATSDPGLYELCAEVMDDLNCSETICTNVTVLSALDVTVDPIVIPCGQSVFDIVAHATDDTNDGALYWYLYQVDCVTGNETLIQDQAYSTKRDMHTFANVNTAATGNCYRVFASNEFGNDASCSQGEVSITVSPTTGTPIDAMLFDTICVGASTTLSINNDTDYDIFDWIDNSTSGSVGTGGPTITVSPTTTTTYTVTATEASGCLDSKTIEVFVNPLPTFSLSDASFCTNTTATVNGPSGMASYSWSDGTSVVGITQNLMTSVAGTYTLTVEDDNGCAASASMTLTEDSTTDLGTTTTDVCDNEQTTLSIAASYTNIQWSNASGPISGEINNTYNAPGAGNYSVTFTDGGCNGVAAFVVNSTDTPSAMVAMDTVEVCRNDAGIDSTFINFVNQITGSAGTWSPIDVVTFSGSGSLNLSDLTNVGFTDANAGYYRFKYTTNTATAPCVDVADTLTIHVKNCDCPSVALQPIGPYCNTGTLDLDGAKVTTAAGNWSVTNAPASQSTAGIIDSDGHTMNLDGLIGGSYELTFALVPVPGGNCPPDNKITITINEAPNAAKVKDAIVCNSNNGTPLTVDLDTLLTANTTGGGTWSTTGSGTIDANNVFDGSGQTPGDEFVFTYAVAGTAPCGPASVDVTIKVRNCNCPLVDLKGAVLCNGGGTINLLDSLTNQSGINGTWTWDGPASAISGDVLDVSNVSAGSYTMTYTLDSEPNPGNGCEQAYTATWVVNKQPVINLADPAPMDPCGIDTDPNDGMDPTMVDLDDYLSGGTSSGAWTQTAGDAVVINSDNTISFAGQTGKTFEFTYTTTNASSPCMNVDEKISITVRSCDCPPINLSDPGIVCNDMGSLDLTTLNTGSDPGTFEVRDATNNSVTITGDVLDYSALEGGVYTITFTLDATVPTGCTQQLTQTLTVSDYQSTTYVDNASASNVDNGTGSHIVDFTALLTNPLMNMSWTDDDGSGVSLANLMAVSFEGVAAGSYDFSFVVDNAEPCIDFVGKVTVTVSACPLLANPTPVCYSGEPIDLFDYNLPNNPGTWSTTESEISITDSRYLNLDNATKNQYEVIYTLDTPVSGCDPQVVTLRIFEQQSSGTGSTVEYCYGESEMINLGQLLSDENLGGVWTDNSASPSGIFNASTAQYDITRANPGTYTFNYAFDNQTPCMDVSTDVNVVIHPNPDADAGNDKVIDCDNPEVLLDGSASTPNTINYFWRKVGGTATLPNNEQQSITVDQAGDYELKVTEMTTDCIDTDTVNVVNQGGVPSITLEEEQPKCFGDKGIVVLSNPTGGSGNYSYTLNGNTITDFNISNLSGGDYTLVMTDNDNGCVRDYKFSIQEPQEFTVDVPEGVQYGFFGQTFTFTLNSSIVDENTMVVWTDNNGTVVCEGTIAECGSIEVTPTQNTTYTVVATTSNGCESRDEVEVRLEEDVDVEFPNIINPESVSGNKIFYVQSKYVARVNKMFIYDRWGELVFSATDTPANDPKFGWDGRFNKSEEQVSNASGKFVKPGVYTFMVELDMQDSSGKPNGTNTYSGDITVLR